MSATLQKIEKFVSCACVAVMAILVFANVIARKVFNHSLAFSDEMSTYLFVLMSFMGTAIAARRGAHLGLSIVTDKLGENARKNVQMLMYGVSAFFCLLIVVFGVQMVASQYSLGQETAAMQWPEWIYGSFCPRGRVFRYDCLLTGASQHQKAVAAQTSERRRNYPNIGEKRKTENASSCALCHAAAEDPLYGTDDAEKQRTGSLDWLEQRRRT